MSNKDIYLFLDFDGVLHPKHGISFSLVKNFENAIAPFKNIKIVFSTSWSEHYSFERLKNLLPCSIQEKCIGKTKIFKEYMIHSRYHEIMEYIKENNVELWIAIDDCDILFPKNCDNLFLLNGKEGLSIKMSNKLKNKIKNLTKFN